MFRAFEHGCGIDEKLPMAERYDSVDSPPKNRDPVRLC